MVVAAVALYCAYWGLWMTGLLALDRSDVPEMPRELFYAATIGAPCALVGAVIARWWAPAVGLAFVALLPIGDSCVETVDGDVTASVCSGFAASDVPLMLALTTPCVLAGVAAVKLWAAWRQRPLVPDPLL